MHTIIVCLHEAKFIPSNWIGFCGGLYMCVLIILQYSFFLMHSSVFRKNSTEVNITEQVY